MVSESVAVRLTKFLIKKRTIRNVDPKAHKNHFLVFPVATIQKWKTNLLRVDGEVRTE